jgi:hypothetical protein
MHEMLEDTMGTMIICSVEVLAMPVRIASAELEASWPIAISLKGESPR